MPQKEGTKSHKLYRTENEASFIVKWECQSHIFFHQKDFRKLKCLTEYVFKEIIIIYFHLRDGLLSELPHIHIWGKVQSLDP